LSARPGDLLFTPEQHDEAARLLERSGALPDLAPETTERPIYLLSIMPSQQIASTEIVRGPGSLLYGTGAMSGVVNLVPRGRDELPVLDGGLVVIPAAQKEPMLRYIRDELEAMRRDEPALPEHRHDVLAQVDLDGRDCRRRAALGLVVPRHEPGREFCDRGYLLVVRPGGRCR